MNNPNKLILDIIAEAALDNRISDGIVDLKKTGHVQIVAELLYDKFEDETLVNEFVQSFLDEGKYPDRQAFNKEGWLVTFPSKEYRDAAIKRGTHAISDPTHGKGGMNLYYKKKGKQKRQTQQSVSQTQTPEPPAAKVNKPTNVPNSTNAVAGTPTQPPSKDPVTSRLSKLSPDSPSASKEKVEPISPQPSTKEPTVATPSGEKSAGEESPTSVPAIDVPVATTPPEQYSSVSKKFAAKKGWKAEPYGEYRDAEGNTVAVVGLSGEVVPVKSVDRDEYKIFAEKSMM